MSWFSEWTGQDAQKQADRRANEALQLATQRYADLGAYRTLGLGALTSALGGGGLDYSSDYAGSPKYVAVNDPLVHQATGTLSATLGRLTNGPDRVQQVRDTLAALDAQDALQRKAGTRQIGQDAARLGRLGSGMVTTSLGDLESDIQRNRANVEAQLIRDATNANVQDLFGLAGLSGNVADSAYGRAANERAVQNALSLQDIQNRVNQRDRQNAQANTRFGQGLAASGVGFGYDPTSAYQAEAARQQQQANQRWGDFMNLIGQGVQAAAGGRGK